MLFNELLDLTYHEPAMLSNEVCDLLLKIVGGNSTFIFPNNLKPSTTTNNTYTIETEHNITSPEQLAILHLLLENILLNDLTKYINIKNSLFKFKFICTERFRIGEFTILNQDFQNTFDVCHALNIYKYLMVIYFLDDNSKITFFNNHTIELNKGDVVIFPIAWFFVYKILKKNQNENNIYIFNNVLKEH